MKYLHRDNFRQLTGHGREIANCADMMLGKLDADSRQRLLSGSTYRRIA
jgi:hypothetical protein